MTYARITGDLSLRREYRCGTCGKTATAAPESYSIDARDPASIQAVLQALPMPFAKTPVGWQTFGMAGLRCAACISKDAAT